MKPAILGRMYGRRRLTRLEIGIYAAGSAVLLTIFINVLLDYMELAEKTALQITLQSIGSALDNRVAADLLRGQPIARGGWSGGNPFDITGAAPPAFCGELGERPLASLERPCWLFDAGRGEVIYLPRLSRRLVTTDPDGALRFRLALRSVAGPGYTLVSTSSYEWDAVP